jgi:hypothetical protein
MVNKTYIIEWVNHRFLEAGDESESSAYESYFQKIIPFLQIILYVRKKIDKNVCDLR